MADPTYEDLRAAYINAEARADQLAERLGKTDAELVETRGVARAAREALTRAEADVAEVAEARKWVADKTGVGGGTRPLSFLIASHEQMARERNAALQRERAASADRGGNWRKLHAENTRLQGLVEELRGNLGQRHERHIAELARVAKRAEEAEAENTRLSSRVATLETTSADAATRAADAADELDHTENCEGDDWCDCPVGMLRRLARDVRPVLASAPASDNPADRNPAVVCNDKNCGLHALHAKLPEPAE